MIFDAFSTGEWDHDVLLREHNSDLDDRTVHNVFETLNTFLRTRDIFIAAKILAELDYAEKPLIPIPAKLVWKIKDRMRERNGQSHDLIFPNGNGKPDGHFLRKLKAIASKAGVEGAELHRFRKTYADTLHEEGVSVNTIRIRLGHESLDVTLAYLKGKDAESEEAQEHANNSSLALYA